MEEWRDIKGYEGKYQVSNLGRIKSINYKKRKGCEGILSPIYDSEGYCRVFLYKNNKSRKFTIHRLVAQTFIPNPNNLPQVNHKDENKANNYASNLEWCDCKYNQNYGTRNKRIGKTLGKKTLCVTTGEIFNSTIEASIKYGVDNRRISECCNKKRNSAGKLPTGEKLKWMYIEEELVYE